MKNIVIEGSQIHDIASFYEEINRVFMQNEDWKLGESLDAFSDLLYGGFGEIKGKEPLQFIWKDIDNSKGSLGVEATKAFYEEKLANPSTYNVSWAKEKLEALENGKGQTYFDIIMEIIREHPNIELIEK